MERYRVFVLICFLIGSSIEGFCQEDSETTVFRIVGLESAIKVTPGFDVVVPLIPNYFHLEYPSGVELVDTLFNGGTMSIDNNYVKLIPFELDSFQLDLVFEDIESQKQVIITKKLYALPTPEVVLHKTACDSMITRSDLILNGNLVCVLGAYRLDVIDYNVEYVSQGSSLLAFSNLPERAQARALSRTSKDGDLIRYSSVIVSTGSGDRVDLGTCTIFVVKDEVQNHTFSNGPVIRR